MNIVTTFNDHSHIVGITSALFSCGYNPIYWNPATKPVFDMFDEVQPDIILCKSTEVDEAMKMALADYPNTKLVIFGIFAGQDIKPSLVCYPENLKPEHVKLINKSGYNFVQLQPAADIAKYYGGVVIDTFKSDALFLSQHTDMVDLNTLYEIANQCTLKIVGNVKLPMAEYLGVVTLSEICNMMKSTKIGLDMRGDFYYNYIANNVFCLTTAVTDLAPHISEFDKYHNQPKLQKKVLKAAHAEVINNHTYYHRTKELFDALGYNEIGITAMDKLKAVLND